MFHFLRRSKVVFDAFISEKYEFVNLENPITRSSSYTPQWWKETPRSSVDPYSMSINRTIKGCVAAVSSFQTGFIVPFWSDIALRWDSQEVRYHVSADASDNSDAVAVHPHSQAPGFSDDYHIVKLSTPWLLHSKSDIKIAYLSPLMHYNHYPLVFIQGINRFVLDIANLNTFCLLKKPDNDVLTTHIIKQHTPMLHLVPLTEKDVDIKCQVISKSEHERYINRMCHTSYSNTGLRRLCMKKG